eukprot:9240082-Lingulodinium_polyedra.AAC.1
MLADSSGVVLDMDPQSDRFQAIQQLKKAALVTEQQDENDDVRFVLTDMGKAAVIAGVKLTKPSLALHPRGGIRLQDMTTWELVFTLCLE